MNQMIVKQNILKIACYANLNLTDVKILDNVTIITDYSFFSNLLTNLLIPDSVTTIGTGAFAKNNLKSIKLRELICGKPSILIYRGKIDEKVLKKERFTINELEERLRGNNIVNLGDVEYAILETSGQVTVIQKPNKRNTIPEDFGIMPDYEGIPYDLVIDGVIMKENIKKIGKNEVWLRKQVEKFNMKPEEALIVTLDGKGQIFCQKKNEEGK